MDAVLRILEPLESLETRTKRPTRSRKRRSGIQDKETYCHMMSSSNSHTNTTNIFRQPTQLSLPVTRFMMSRPAPIDTQSSNAVKRLGQKLGRILTPKKLSFSPTSPKKLAPETTAVGASETTFLRGYTSWSTGATVETSVVATLTSSR
jgi:hypothetical protein